MADKRTIMQWFLLKQKRQNVISNRPRRKNTSIIKKYVKRQQEMFLYLNLILACIHQPRIREVWTHPRTDTWFELAYTLFNDQLWYQNFRVTRATFAFILGEIAQDITRNDTTMRKCIPSERRLALTVYWLSSTAEYRTIANLFGVSTSFVCICIKDVCEAINRRLSRVIRFPRGEDLVRVIDSYEQKWRIPMCAGAIDGTHIPILAPADNHLVYVNRKGFHSIVMQAVVDASYLFRDVVIGWPGSVHDARVLSNSSIYQTGNNNQLFPGIPAKHIQGEDISPFIIGDPAYPLLSWLMKPYKVCGNQPIAERVFNYSVSRARMTVENTFGRWKGRFTRFGKRVDMDVTSVIPVAKASCILHNLCELQQNVFLPEWELPQEEPLYLYNDIVTANAEDIRTALTNFLIGQQ